IDPAPSLAGNARVEFGQRDRLDVVRPQRQPTLAVLPHGVDTGHEFAEEAPLARRLLFPRHPLPTPSYSARHPDGYSFRPRAGCPRSRKVFGYSPSPQILKEPKSLYQAPSGASGSDSRQSLSSYRSLALISLSRRRSNRWSRRAGGRSFHRILGISRRRSGGP